MNNTVDPKAAKMPKKAKKTVIITAICVLAAVFLSVLSYLLYVVCTYYRIEDNLPLSVVGDAGDSVPTGESLTLVTYNIGFGAYSSDYSFFMDGGEHSRAFSEQAVIDNTNGAVNTIKAQAPDFILLQEVDVDGTRSYHVDQTELISEQFSRFDRVFAQNYDSPYFLYPFGEPIGANKSGVMTLSSFNIGSAVRKSLPIEDTLYKFLDLDRCYTVSRIGVENGKTLVMYNVHLSAYTSDGRIADEQMKMLAADMDAEYKKGNYVIAAGDFNKDLLGDSSEFFSRGGDGEYTWAKPFDMSLLPNGVTLYTGSNFPTCRNADSPFRSDGTDFVLSVDGVLVSENVKVISCVTASTGFAYSDHDPVRLEFLLE